MTPSHFNTEQRSESSLGNNSVTVGMKQASEDDLMAVLLWLLDEYKATGISFWSNAHLIVQDQSRGRLWVLFDERLDVPVGFHCPKILASHWQWRGKGIGGALVDHIEKMARDKGETELHIESLWPALRFWERHGYSPVTTPSHMHTISLVKKLR